MKKHLQSAQHTLSAGHVTSLSGVCADNKNSSRASQHHVLFCFGNKLEAFIVSCVSAFHFKRPSLWGSWSILRENQVHKEHEEGKRRLHLWGLTMCWALCCALELMSISFQFSTKFWDRSLHLILKYEKMIARVVKGFVQSPLPGSQSQTQVRGLQTPLHMTVRITPASSDPPNTPRKQERTISCIRKYDPGNTESSTYVLNVLDTHCQFSNSVRFLLLIW